MSADHLPIRYAIYTRQSVERPSDLSSCEAQFERCQAMIRAKSGDLEWIGTRFDDEGYSGGTVDRPALIRLRKLIAARKVDRVYVTALDRLSRRVVDLTKLLDEFEKAGAILHLAQELMPQPGGAASSPTASGSRPQRPGHSPS